VGEKESRPTQFIQSVTESVSCIDVEILGREGKEELNDVKKS